jgi:hypothetical protein
MVFQGICAAAAFNAKLAHDILDCEGLVGQVTMGEGSTTFNLPDCPLSALPIFEIQFAQIVSLVLAQFQGFESRKFLHASKLTTVE